MQIIVPPPPLIRRDAPSAPHHVGWPPRNTDDRDWIERVLVLLDAESDRDGGRIGDQRIDSEGNRDESTVERPGTIAKTSDGLDGSCAARPVFHGDTTEESCSLMWLVLREWLTLPCMALCPYSQPPPIGWLAGFATVLEWVRFGVVFAWAFFEDPPGIGHQIRACRDPRPRLGIQGQFLMGRGFIKGCVGRGKDVGFTRVDSVHWTGVSFNVFFCSVDRFSSFFSFGQSILL